MRQTVKLIILTLLCLVAVLPVQGQTDPQLSQYYEVPSFYNPAAIGRTDFIRIRGGARLQWLGIEKAPRTFVAAADMPVKIGSKRLGVGLVVDQESAGLYSTLNVDAQVAYKFKKLGGMWTVGLQVGYLDQGFKGSEVDIPDDDDYHEGNDDALPQSDIHGGTVDFAAGLFYEHKYFWAGLSGTHLTAPTVKMKTDSSDGGTDATGGNEKYFEFGTKRTLYFMAGGNIPVKNTLFDILPSVIVRSDFSFTTGQLDARVRYNKFLTFGVGYRWKDALIATLAAEYKNFFIGYSYEYSTSAIAKVSSGSHEIFAGYSLKLNLGDKNRNRHKSIRVM